MFRLYVSNNGHCAGCVTAEQAIQRWKGQGRLVHEPEVRPIPENQDFYNYIRCQTQGRLGIPLLVNQDTHEIVVGWVPDKYEELLT